MTHDESTHEDSEDRFYAQFDSREVELMTLDELAAAFEAGQIHANTFVCREGDSEWLTLAEVAGLGEEDEAEPEPAPVVERRPPMPERRPEMPVAASVAAESRPPMPERRPEMPQRRPEMNTQPAARFQPQSVAPAAPIATPSHSFAPVTSNVDYSNLDFDELAMRPKRRWGLVLAAAAVLALAGGGTVFAINGGGSALASAVPDKAALQAAASHSQASLTLSNIQAKASEPAPVAPSEPAPVAAAAPAAEAPKSAGLSEDMKQALLASDKTRDSKKAKKSKGRATTASAAPRRNGKVASAGGGFKSGGSAYDPLNGKL
jgi:preprotein translocase subunit SecD